MKKITFLFFSLLLILGNTSLNFSILTACAESVEENTFSYIINADDSITITGIYENKEEIIIPSQYLGKSVKKIDDYAFWNNDCIKSVELSDGIEEIGVSAFGYCTSLNNVVLPANIFIYHDAFRNCPELTSIIIPREVKLEEHIVNEKNAYTVFGYLDLPVSTGSSAVVEQKNQNFTIYGFTNTVAETYANENGFTFIALDDDPDTTTTTTTTDVTTTTTETTTDSTETITETTTTSDEESTATTTKSETTSLTSDTTTEINFATTTITTAVVTTDEAETTDLIENITATTETTTTATTHIASDDELCEWAVKDYVEKTGVKPANAEIEYTADDTAIITLIDVEGNVLDIYTIDPTTGIGKASDGGTVDLPQTGYSNTYKVIIGFAILMTIGGTVIVAKSRRRRTSHS